LDYHQEIVKTFLIPTISAGFMGVAAYFVYQGFQILTGLNWLAALIAIVVAIVVYFALLLFMKGVDEDELEFLPKSASIIRFLKKLRLL
jgi:stage V sporulation protein B